ncbi:hypothetical protein EI94DRAFT_1796024 [Lactarius quietus]|nr:hypothetical protein EI94DRAFT_1796024 [Lactarius quietus]
MEACISLTSGPTATTAEARKNKKKCMMESDHSNTTPPQAPKPTPAKLTVSVTAEAVMDEAATQAVTPAYPPLETSPTPPPILMPPLFNEDSPSLLFTKSIDYISHATPPTG